MARESEDNQRRPGKSERDKKDWYKEGCSELSKMERWNVNNRGRNGVNLAISAKGTILDKN